MKKIIAILILCSSCVSTDKLLMTYSKDEVVKIEQKKFERKQSARPAELFMISLFIFGGASFTDYAYSHDLLKRK